MKTENALSLADCHLHFEGCLPSTEIAKLAVRAGHPFADSEAFETARTSMTDAAGFLGLFADVCRLFRRPEDYVGAALAVAGALADDRVDYAEIYVSPEIFSRILASQTMLMPRMPMSLRKKSSVAWVSIALTACEKMASWEALNSCRLMFSRTLLFKLAW